MGRYVEVDAPSDIAVGPQSTQVEIELPPELAESLTLGSPFNYSVEVPRDSGAETIVQGTAPYDGESGIVAVPVAGIAAGAAPENSYVIVIASGPLDRDRYTVHPGDYFTTTMSIDVSDSVKDLSVPVELDALHAVNEVGYSGPSDPVAASWGQVVDVILPANASWSNGVHGEWSGLSPTAVLTWLTDDAVGEISLKERITLSNDHRTLSVALPEEESEYWVSDGRPEIRLGIMSAGSSSSGRTIVTTTIPLSFVPGAVETSTAKTTPSVQADAAGSANTNSGLVIAAACVLVTGLIVGVYLRRRRIGG